MASYTKCSACGAVYDSNTRHVCSKGEDLQKAYFGSEESRGEVGGDGYNSPDR
mgnify:CR=1 FL=1